MNQVTDTDPNSIRIALKVVDESPGESPFAKLSVVFDSKRVQPSASGGISFWLTVSNGSKQVLQMQSPLEALQISLLDSKGWPVRLPPASLPRTVVNYKGPYEVIRPYRLIELEDIGSGRDLLSIAEDLNWTLPEEDALRIGIKIDRILPGGSVEPTPQTVPIPIPEGSYRLKLVVVLISVSGDRAHRLFNSDYIGLKLGEN
jgi:hypothetical protein